MSPPRLFVAFAVLVFAKGWTMAESAAPAATAREKPKEGGGFVFSLLPKSLQKNPRLDFNIVTEMSPEGRRRKPATPQAPVYYVAQAGGMRNTGVGAESGLKGPPPEQLQRMLEKSLAEGGYLPGDDAGHKPAIAIIYHWGSSSFQPPESVADAAGASADDPSAPPAGTGDVPVPEIELRKALLDRAMLLGGAKFAREVARAMEQTDHKAALQRTFAAPEGGGFMGSVGDMLRDPFDELRARSPEMERLVDELFSSSFYVIASAYDYAALAKGQRLILWRTKLTVNSLGVNMAESIPPLVASGAPYFGRETPDPVVITKRVVRDGRVDVGTPVVVPDPGKSPGAAPSVDPTKPAAKDVPKK